VRQVDDLVAAYRVLAEHRVIDAYGHISVRSEKNPNRYLLAGHIAPELVREENIIEYDLDSNPLDANGRESVRERFIHGEIFKRRPEVMSVVHTHSHSVVPFSITPNATLKPIFHMAAFIGHGVPNWDIADAQRGTDLLVKTPFLGAHLAQCVGDKPAALLRGHGAVVVGETIARAVGRAIYLEMSAQMQIQAQLLAGPGTKLLTIHDDEVAASVPAQNYNRAWPMWRARALAQVAAEKTLRDYYQGI
jgi:ribulose-5-phosphate 4-epimerase/fuculose-1-phosphate aldolase